MTSARGSGGSVVLHIGMEKTGTTAIQRFLAGNATVIREGGATASTLTRWSAPSLIAACVVDPTERQDLHAIYEVHEGNQAAVRSLVQRHLASEGAAGLPVVVSSEHLSSRAVRSDDVRRLADLIESVATEVVVLLYLRRQDALIPSTYSTSVMAGGVREFSLQAALEERDRYDYRALIERWRAVFGDRVAVHVFREEWKDSPVDLLRHFCRHAGIAWNEAFVLPDSRVNVSLSRQALDLGRWLNQLAADGRVSREARRDVMLRLQELRYRHPFALADDERALVWSHFHAANQQASVWLSADDARYLLDPPAPMGSQPPHDAPAAEMREVIAALRACVPTIDIDSAPFLTK